MTDRDDVLADMDERMSFYPDGRPVYFDRDGEPLRLLDWGAKREDVNYCRIGLTEVGEATVVTTWMGMNTSIGASPPVIFETMICEGPYSLSRMPYATEDEARQGHSRTVDDLRAERVPWFLDDAQ